MKGPDEAALIQNIRAQLPGLQALMKECEDMWGYEDCVFRFYHQSFKVFHLQGLTLQIVEAMRQLLPERELNAWFLEIVTEGTGRQFSWDDNRHWVQSTRPIVEAFFHAHYFLEMICKYAKTIQEPPEELPSGWAAVLYLYNMRH